MKSIVVFAALVLSFLLADAAGYNTRQESLRTGIESSLKSKGYAVERRDDGLKFVADGDTYFIEIDKDETNPMYVRLCRYVKFDDKLRRADAIKKITDYNSSYAVKVQCKEKNLIISTEMFVTSADQFNYAFGDMLALMKSTYKEIAKK